MIKDIFITRLKQEMKNQNFKQIHLAKETGITASSISDWLKGKYFPKQDKIEKIAKALNVSAYWLSGYEVEKNIKENIIEQNEEINEIFDNTLKIPLLGDICAGEGIYVDEVFEDFIYIDNATKADFALRVKGDSMIEAGILNGDIVFIKKQSYISNGKIAAIILTETNEATLKKVYKKENHILLQPCNSNYEPIITKDIIVVGEYVGLYRKI